MKSETKKRVHLFVESELHEQVLKEREKFHIQTGVMMTVSQTYVYLLSKLLQSQ